MRLRRSDLAAAGISRRRHRKNSKRWSYLDAQDRPVTDPATIARIDALVLPPAWTDVWIAPYANGHIQAVGTDAAGRRQYRYHDEWRRKRDLEKFDRILDFAELLPKLRRLVEADLQRPGMPERRVRACAARMLDIGFFRVGGEEYAEQNNSFGLATMRREHTSVGPDGSVIFDYPAKSGKQRYAAVADPQGQAQAANSSTTQSPAPQQESLADAARKAREAKKESTKPPRVFDNDNLPGGTISTVGKSAEPKDGDAATTDATVDGKKSDANSEKAWRDKFAALRAKLARDQEDLNVMQRELGVLNLQNYSDPTKAMQQELTRSDINKKTADIDAKQKQIQADQQAIEDAQDELRKAGGDSGWAR